MKKIIGVVSNPRVFQEGWQSIVQFDVYTDEMEAFSHNITLAEFVKLYQEILPDEPVDPAKLHLALCEAEISEAPGGIGLFTHIVRLPMNGSLRNPGAYDKIRDLIKLRDNGEFDNLLT